MIIDPRTLDQRIRIERALMADNAFGEPVPTSWVELGRVWAKVTYGTGVERREAAQEGASAPATFRVRRSPVTEALKETDRLRHAGDPWDISSIVPFARVGFDITATRKTS